MKALVTAAEMLFLCNNEDAAKHKLKHTRVGVLQLGTRPVAVRPAAPVDQLEVALARRRRWTLRRIGTPHLQMMPPALRLVVVLLLLQKPLLSQPPLLESPELALPLLPLSTPPLLLLPLAPPPLLPPLDLLLALWLLLPLPLLALVLPVLLRAPPCVYLPHEVPVPLPVEAVVELSYAVRPVVPVPPPRVPPRRMPVAAVAKMAVDAIAVLVAGVGKGTDEVPRQFVRRLGEDRGRGPVETRGGRRQGVHLLTGEPVLRVGHLVIPRRHVARLRGQRGGPALQRVRQADSADLDVGPVAHGDDFVRDAGRREDCRDVVEGVA